MATNCQLHATLRTRAHRLPVDGEAVMVGGNDPGNNIVKSFHNNNVSVCINDVVVLTEWWG